jgi:hypothetical protein
VVIAGEPRLAIVRRMQLRIVPPQRPLRRRPTPFGRTLRQHLQTHPPTVVRPHQTPASPGIGKTGAPPRWPPVLSGPPRWPPPGFASPAELAAGLSGPPRWPPAGFAWPAEVAAGFEWPAEMAPARFCVTRRAGTPLVLRGGFGGLGPPADMRKPLARALREQGHPRLDAGRPRGKSPGDGSDVTRFEEKRILPPSVPDPAYRAERSTRPDHGGARGQRVMRGH